ncbi:LAFA_0G05292g1_1 [Lachancea sp. 'fantastica']|nr:LAFA_0G05292g1_1 [Lachancea sp. 'fantastica']
MSLEEVRRARTYNDYLENVAHYCFRVASAHFGVKPDAHAFDSFKEVTRACIADFAAEENKRGLVLMLGLNGTILAELERPKMAEKNLINEKMMVTVIKNSPQLDTEKPVETQLFAISSSHAMSHAALGHLMSTGVSSILDHTISSSRASELKNDALYNIRSKMSELSNLVDNVESEAVAPDMLSTVHPLVRHIATEGATKDNIQTFLNEHLKDNSTLNSLQTTVLGWTQSLRHLTELTREVEGGTLEDEVMFWDSVEKALVSVHDQIQDPGVQLTIEVLHEARRLQTSFIHISQTVLAERLKEVGAYNLFLGDIPISKLRAITSLDQLHSLISELNSSLKKLKVCAYPVSRAQSLLRLLTKEFIDRLRKVAPELSAMDFKTFESSVKRLQALLKAWDDLVADQILLFREIVRRRSEKLKLINQDSQTSAIRLRIEQLQATRNNLQAWKVDILQTGLTKYLNLVNEAFEAFSSVNSLNCSNDVWDTATDVYKARCASLEATFAGVLRFKLNSCQEASEMFAVLESFQPLLTRARLRASLQDFHRVLFNSVLLDLIRLKNRFSNQLLDIQASQSLDIPAFSSRIMRNRNIEKRIKSIVMKATLLFGDEWKDSDEGRPVHEECTSMLELIKTEETGQDWISTANFSLDVGNQPVLGIQKNLNQFSAHVTSNGTYQNGFKEIRNLKWQGFTFSRSVGKATQSIRTAYPLAIDLSEHLDTFLIVANRIKRSLYLKALLNEQVGQAFILLGQCMEIKWNSLHGLNSLLSRNSDDRLSNSQTVLAKFRRLSASVIEAFNATETLDEKLRAAMQSLSDGPYLEDRLKINIEVIVRLSEKFTTFNNFGVQAFMKCLDYEMVNQLTSAMEKALKTERLPKQVLTVKISSGRIAISPRLELAKSQWVNYTQMILHIASQSLKTFRVLQRQNGMIPRKNVLSSFLRRASLIVNKSLRDQDLALCNALASLQRWKKHEGLWNMTDENIFEKAAASLETIFPVYTGLSADLETVQSICSQLELTQSLTLILKDLKSTLQIFLRSWQERLLKMMKEFYVAESRDFHQYLSKSRTTLEREAGPLTISSLGSYSELFAAIEELVQAPDTIKTRLSLIGSVYEVTRGSRGFLATNAISLDQLELDVMSLRQALRKRLDWIDQNKSIIIPAFDRCFDVIESAANFLEVDRAQNKAVNSTRTPTEALEALDLVGIMIDKYSEQLSQVNQLCSVLALPKRSIKYLSCASKDIADQRQAWTAIHSNWSTLQLLLQTKWSDIKLPELKSHLESFLSQQYGDQQNVQNNSVFNSFLTQVHSVNNAYKKLMEIKECHLRARHWSSLLGGNDKNNESYEKIDARLLSLKDILQVVTDSRNLEQVLHEARSEAVLEDSLESIEAHWKSTEFRRKEHLAGLILVTEWRVLFELVDDDLETLRSMKSSAHYKHFDHLCENWERKLNSLASIFKDWSEAQRLWLYLQAALSTRQNSILRSEWSKFEGLSSDFAFLISRVFETNVASDVLIVRDFHKLLQSILESLRKIMDSLDKYLDTQRKHFPRLYFLGNEDLLQLMGASQNLEQASLNFGKLYMGVSSLHCNERAICGVVSREGELLSFEAPIEIGDYPEMKDWLIEVDNRIKLAVLTAVESCLARMHQGGLAMLIQMFEECLFQAALLSLQIWWTLESEKLLNDMNFDILEKEIRDFISHLTYKAEATNNLICRKKAENLIIESVHLQSILNTLKGCDSAAAVNVWTDTFKYYHSAGVPPLQCIQIKVGNSIFYHGLEYIGVPERLIYTPLLSNCFTAMAHALSQKKGGSPFGPAGTGKTETVKALGQNLGRMVLVFNCDDSFDFPSLGRLLLGIAQLGAWGCFDEFNRLNKSIMSAVSSQIGELQEALFRKEEHISILGKTSAPLHNNTGLFVTMNYGYKGRHDLPDNLKNKFRSFSMSEPDNEIIAEVILLSLGFREAHEMSLKITSFFKMLQERCSDQKYYDFGLRAMKAVLRNCKKLRQSLFENNLDRNLESLVYLSLHQLLEPRLEDKDLLVFRDVLSELFDDVKLQEFDQNFSSNIKAACLEQKLEPTDEFSKKCRQLFHIQKSQHATIISGPSGTGKSCVWKTTLNAMTLMDEVENTVYIIDSKVLSKSQLYGSLDPVTFEWSDGLFTSLLRQITRDALGMFQKKRLWIVFDGDLDSDYVETLNSVLDDNRVFTLPNGERFNIPSNLRFIFEVETLEAATPATISRCAVVIVGRELYNTIDVLRSQLHAYFDRVNFRAFLDDLKVTEFVKIVLETFGPLLERLYWKVQSHFKNRHIALTRLIETFVSLAGSKVLQETDKLCIMSSHAFITYLKKSLAICLAWAASSDCDESDKVFVEGMVEEVSPLATSGSSSDGSLTDLFVSPRDLDFVSLSTLVPRVSLEPHQVLSPDLLIATLDTVKHERFIFDLLTSGKSLILCGPPGSGKTMTLYNALKNSKRFELIGLTFSKETSVDTIRTILKHHTTLTENATDMVMQPKSMLNDLVLFCDEINLPSTDNYGMQPSIMFLRQILEKRGFWNTEKCKWVRLERILIVGACNPADGAARQVLTERFLRLTPILSVQYPGSESLRHIYMTLFDATFKLVPNLRDYATDFAEASLDLYLACCQKFSSHNHSLYVLSPRDLTRWIKGIHYILSNSTVQNLSELIEIWFYEGSRLFGDRLVKSATKQEFRKAAHSTISKFFPGQQSFNTEEDILITNWTTTEYKKTSRREIAAFVTERLKVFIEEELECSLIPTASLINHMVRVDRVLKQEQGHCIMAGPNRSAKRSLVRFVSWLNGMEVVQLLVHRNFDISDFERLLKSVMIKCSIDNRKVVLLVDDSSTLDPGFIERMNTLLANSDIPGLFEGEERHKLMTDLSTRAEKLGLLLDSNEELYGWFTALIAHNLHVVFTINNTGSQGATSIMSSPALLNRCVLDFMDQWSNETFSEIGNVVLQWMPLDQGYQEENIGGEVRSQRMMSDTLVNTAVELFRHYQSLQIEPLSYGKFFDHLSEFQRIYSEKTSELESLQYFMSTGLECIKKSALRVKELAVKLSEKKKILEVKELEARQSLDKMLVTQNEAERKHEASVEIRKILEVQERDLTSQRTQIKSDLAVVEPEILEAQRGVTNIKKQHMTEIRSMINPPKNVKLTLEAVCIILGQGYKEWKDIQHYIRKDEFIANIVHYDTSKMMDDFTRSYVEDNYISRPGFTYDAVNHASKACGPLYQWVVAQVKYASMLTTVLPLKNHVLEVEQNILQTKSRLLAAEDMIVDYQKITEESKTEYSLIIRDIEVIKSELAQVQQKVSRSQKVLESLVSENSRWSSSIAKFNENKSRVVGDSFLSATYITYCMCHNAGARNMFISHSKKLLSSMKISYDENYNFSDHSVRFEEKSKWIEDGLPEDETCIENFYAMFKLRQYAFVIDPESIMTSSITKHFGERLIVTSFLDSGFVKKLRNALKFGTTILIEDGDYFDPIISTLVAQEFKTIGGRKTVKIGEETVDVSSNFKLIIASKNAACPIPGFVRARMSIVRFVIDNFSLQAQSLELTLRHEKPELCRERLELRQLNESYKMRLHSLEKDLLDALSGSDSDLLENDSLLSMLEQVKTSASEVQVKVKETRGVLDAVEKATTEYEVIGRHAMTIYSVMEQLSSLHWSYQISIKSFLRCAASIFASESPVDQGRPQQLLSLLYQKTFQFYSPSMTEEHKIVLAILLFTRHLELDFTSKLHYEFRELLSSISENTDAEFEALDEIGLSAPESDAALAYIKGLKLGVSNDCVFSQFSGTMSYFQNPTPMGLEEYIDANIDEPLLILLERGADDTSRLSQLAALRSQNLLTISLGSLESTVMAETALSDCIRTGHWLLLQNLQMSPAWVRSVLTRRLESMANEPDISRNFRLFLTCDLESTDMPPPLLRRSWHFVQGRKRGILATALDVWSTLGHQTAVKETLPAQLFCYFILAWFHALLVEYSNLHPLGFTKNFDFNDADYSSAIFYLERLFNSIDDHKSIPWSNITFNICAIIYGGKIDNEKDLNLCITVGSRLFTADALEPDFEIAPEVLAPRKDNMKWGDYKQWLLQCPAPDSWSKWLGLGDDLENEQQSIQAQRIARSVLAVSDDC